MSFFLLIQNKPKKLCKPRSSCLQHDLQQRCVSVHTQMQIEYWEWGVFVSWGSHTNTHWAWLNWCWPLQCWICIWIQLWAAGFMPLWLVPNSAFFQTFSLYSLSHLPQLWWSPYWSPILLTFVPHRFSPLYLLFASAGPIFHAIVPLQRSEEGSLWVSLIFLWL